MRWSRRLNAATIGPAQHQRWSMPAISPSKARRAKPQQAPAKQDGDQQLPDACAICAVMAMASTVLSASPPILLLPEAVELLYRSTDAEFVHLKSAGSGFQPRAPPAS